MQFYRDQGRESQQKTTLKNSFLGPPIKVVIFFKLNNK
jgi:hypothetical protein